MKRMLPLLLAFLACTCTPEPLPRYSLPSSYSVKVGDVTDFHEPWSHSNVVGIYASSLPEKYIYDDESDLLSNYGSGRLYDKSEVFQRAYAVSPYRPSAVFSEESGVAVTIPAKQSYNGKWADPSADILVAATSDLDDEALIFHTVVGFATIRLSGIGVIKSLTLSGNGSESVAGDGIVHSGYGKVPSLEFRGSEKSIVIDCGSDGVNSKDGLDFVFCLPPVAFPQGVTVVVKTTEGDIEHRIDAGITIKRAQAVDLGSIGYGKRFVSFGLRSDDGKVFRSDDILGPGFVVCVPKGTNLKKLTPIFEFEGLSVSCGGTEVRSGAKALDFSGGALDFVVKSSKGETTTYNVTALDFDIPVVSVSTPDHAVVADKVNWHQGSTFIIRDTDGTIEDYGSSAIKGRGNASWNRPKKSYGIKLAEKPKDRKVLGLPGHKRWVMIAVQWGYFGNNIGYELARRSEGIKWQPTSRYVEFVLNGVHIGTYLLVEQIRIDKHRIDIKSLHADDVSDEKITGGYLMTFDNSYNDPIKFKSKYFNMPVMVKDPDEDEITDKQFSYIQNYINEMEEAVYDSGKRSTQKYREYMDVDSYIDMYFVWETAGKVGSYEGSDFTKPRSCWFYKDRGGVFTTGPCWDFDSYLFSSQKLYCNKCQYYGYLFKDPWFVARVKQKWPGFRDAVEGRGAYGTPITEYLDSCYNRVKYSAKRDREMWSFIKYDIETEYSTIRTGLPAKLEWLENEVNNF